MEPTLGLKDALDIYQTQYGQVDLLWNYFSVVTLAVLGFAIGSEKATASLREASLIVAGYLVFCIGNASALFLGHGQLIEFARLAIAAGQRQGLDMAYLAPLPTGEIRAFYWAVVASVCLGVLAISHWRRR